MYETICLYFFGRGSAEPGNATRQTRVFEERTIGACIESLLELGTDLETEIILVDSASTDRTLEIAGRYPITIKCEYR